MKPELDLKGLSLRAERTPADTIVPRRHILSRYVLPAGLICGFLALMGWSARNAWLPRQPVTVVPVYVSLGEIRTAGTPLFKAAGWIQPRPTPIRVAALAPGVVRELLVVEDQFVHAGEPIARLVDEDAKLALAQAEAALRIRQAEEETAKAVLTGTTTNLNVPAHLELPLAEAEAELAAVETEVSNLPNQLARAKARLSLAEFELTAKQKAASALSGIVVRQAQAELDAAQAEVDELTKREPVLQQRRTALIRRRDAAATRLQLKTDETQLKANAEAELAAAAGRVAEAEVTVAQAKLRLDRMTINAPVDGRILDLIVAPGAQLMEGYSGSGQRDGNTVVTMYQPEQLQVRVDVRFEDLPRVGRDQPVEIRSPALKEPLNGRVLFLTGSANIQKNTLEVKVSIESPPEFIKPEMLVDVTFLASEQAEGEDKPTGEYRLFIPRALVDMSGDSQSVWIADTTELVARKRTVQLGAAQTPTLVEVVSGLDASSRLISTGREGLQDGARIEIRGEDQAVGMEASTPSQDPSRPDRHPK